MHKTFLLGIIFSSQLFTSEVQQDESFRLITIEELPWVESREPSEINYDSFAASVISFYDFTDVEITHEMSEMGNSFNEAHLNNERSL